VGVVCGVLAVGRIILWAIYDLEEYPGYEETGMSCKDWEELSPEEKARYTVEPGLDDIMTEEEYITRYNRFDEPLVKHKKRLIE